MTPNLPFKQKHKWDHANERRFAHTDTKDGCSRNERDCLICGCMMITVLPPNGLPYHEWRTKAGGDIVWTTRPECVAPKPAAVHGATEGN